MNRVNFWHKRAHWSGVKWSNKLLAPFGLTAARFDILYALDNYGGGVEQRTLRQDLGIARSTISVMLRRLEELGLVSVVRRGRGRTCSVRLTELAARALRAAMDQLVAGVQLAYETILAFHKAPPKPMYEVAEYADRLTDLARALGDRAQPVYLDDVDDLGDEDEIAYLYELYGVD